MGQIATVNNAIEGLHALRGEYPGESVEQAVEEVDELFTGLPTFDVDADTMNTMVNMIAQEVERSAPEKIARDAVIAMATQRREAALREQKAHIKNLGKVLQLTPLRDNIVQRHWAQVVYMKGDEIRPGFEPVPIHETFTLMDTRFMTRGYAHGFRTEIWPARREAPYKNYHGYSLGGIFEGGRWHKANGFMHYVSLVDTDGTPLVDIIPGEK